MLTVSTAFEVRDELDQTALLLEVLKQSFDREGYEAQYFVVSLIKDRLEKSIKDLSINQ